MDILFRASLNMFAGAEFPAAMFPSGPPRVAPECDDRVNLAGQASCREAGVMPRLRGLLEALTEAFGECEPTACGSPTPPGQPSQSCPCSPPTPAPNQSPAFGMPTAPGKMPAGHAPNQVGPPLENVQGANITLDRPPSIIRNVQGSNITIHGTTTMPPMENVQGSNIILADAGQSPTSS